jgi:hypothetical protein
MKMSSEPHASMILPMEKEPTSAHWIGHGLAPDPSIMKSLAYYKELNPDIPFIQPVVWSLD